MRCSNVNYYSRTSLRCVNVPGQGQVRQGRVGSKLRASKRSLPLMHLCLPPITVMNLLNLPSHVVSPLDVWAPNNPPFHAPFHAPFGSLFQKIFLSKIFTFLEKCSLAPPCSPGLSLPLAEALFAGQATSSRRQRPRDSPASLLLLNQVNTNSTLTAFCFQGVGDTMVNGDT